MRSRSSESPADGDDAGKVSRSEEAVETAPLAQAEESAESEIVSGQASENSAAITSPEPSEAVAASAESQIEPFYQLPPVALFDRPRVKRKVSHEPDQRGLLEQTLATFGVEAKVVSVSQGQL